MLAANAAPYPPPDLSGCSRAASHIHAILDGFNAAVAHFKSAPLYPYFACQTYHIRQLTV
jgi:hypothetical protein